MRVTVFLLVSVMCSLTGADEDKRKLKRQALCQSEMADVLLTLGGVGARLSSVESQVASIKSLEIRLAVAESQVASIKALETRVSVAESQVASIKVLETRLSVAELSQVASIKALETRLSVAESQVASIKALETSLSVAESQVASIKAFETRLSVAESQVASIKALETRLSVAESQVASIRALETRLSEAENQVTALKKEPGKAPTNLTTSEVTSHSFRASWTPSGGPVEKYRVEYMNVSGHPRQVIVNGTVTTVVLENLNPQTEYLVSVSSYSTTETTRGVGVPTNLTTSEVTSHSFRASWTAPPGGPVEKYRVEYMNVSGHPQQVMVNGTVTSVVLENLNPQTEYLVSVYSVVGEESSEPLKGKQTTQNRCVGWRVFGSSCYIAFPGEKSWDKSRLDCERRGDGAHLVAINSRAEQKFVTSIKPYPGSTWIGLNDKDREATWVWLDQTRPSQTFWARDEPGEGRYANCVLISGDFVNNWYDRSCGTTAHWICERDL